MISSRSLLALILSGLLLSLVRADFENDDIDDSYSLRFGGESCAEKVELDDDELLIRNRNIELNDQSCEGGDIGLLKSPSTGGNSIVRYFRDNLGTSGDFLAGPATSDISCGGVTIAGGTQFVLIKPDDDINVEWEELLGPDSAIEEAAGDNNIELDEDDKYLFVGEDCFYAETNLGDRAECFPGTATVTLENGSERRMADVRTGDRVLVAPGTYSEVFGWTHRTPRSSANYVALSTKDGLRLTTTHGHFVYADDKAVRADTVRVGQFLRSKDGTASEVTSVRYVGGWGLYNPQTVHGDIVVNGVVSTTYTSTVPRGLAHSLLAPLRALYAVVRAVAPVGKAEL